MRLLTNENIPLASVNILMNEGFDVLAVGHGFLGFLDHEVMELAIEHKRTIVTFDRDYGELIFKKGYRPEAGVIYLRWKTFRPEDPGLFLVDLFRSGNISFENKLTVISEESIRQKSYDL